MLFLLSLSNFFFFVLFCFLVARWGLWVLGGRTQRQSFILIASCKVYMLSTCLIIVNNLDPLAEEVFVRFLHSKLTLRCPFRIVPFGKESLLRCSLPKEPISRANELDSIALRKERHLEVFYVGYLSVLPHLLIYLDIHIC